MCAGYNFAIGDIHMVVLSTQELEDSLYKNLLLGLLLNYVSVKLPNRKTW